MRGRCLPVVGIERLHRKQPPCPLVKRRGKQRFFRGQREGGEKGDCELEGFLSYRVDMINRADTASTINSNTIGVLSDTEVLLVDVLQGKRVLRSILLPSGARELRGLLEFLWQAGLTEAWVMLGTPLSHAATCAWFEQISPSWIVLPHSNVRQPTRPDCVLLWPKERSTGRRLVLVFPEHAGWGWALADTRSLLATVTYLEQVLGWPISDAQ